MKVTITGDVRSGFGWSDGILTVCGFDTPQEALDNYLARNPYVVRAR